MKIAYINTFDIGGGAETIFRNLRYTIGAFGHTSHLVVGKKRNTQGNAVEIPNDMYRSRQVRFFVSIHNRLASLEGKRLGATIIRKKLIKLIWFAQRKRQKAIKRGEEDFDFPGTQHLLELIPNKPDIIHCHNLHGDYFDLRYLSELSKNMPVVVTLHDEWMMTGHCACFIDCDRWKIGCGECPDLSVYPSIARDATAYNWARKQDIYSRSRLFVVTPSKWLMDKVEHSILAPAIVDSRVINNGVDLNIFKPGDKAAARDRLGISQNAKVLLFTAYGIRKNKFKDFKTLSEAIERISICLPEVDLQFFALGETAEPEHIGKATLTFVPYSSDPGFVAAYYQASDVYLHAANSEVWGLTITEALACGTPVVATAVGGIPEQIEHGVTGFLVPPRDPVQMAEKCIALLSNDKLIVEFSSNAAEQAKERFNQDIMVEQYLSMYQNIVEC